MKKEVLVVLTSLLLASCSAEGDPEKVSQQKVDSPAAANDRLAPAKPVGATNGKLPASDNPFVKLPDEEVQQLAENPQDDYQDDDAVVEDSLSGVAIRESDVGYLEWAAPEDTAYSKAEVVITDANGKRLQRSFAPGEAIVVDESLPDGHYLWESVVTPEIDPSVREEMRAVRESGNFEAEQQMLARLRAEGSLPTEAQVQENRKSGSFSVKDGVATPITPTYSDDEPQSDSQ